MIVPRHYENLNILHENTLPARTYYIPSSKRMDRLVEHREESDRILFLNGTWKFRYYNSIYDVKEEFYREGYDVSAYDEIKVPGVWQNAGYDRHQYTNVRYPFPFDPPYVPQDIPCGAYVREFNFQKDAKAGRVYLNFEGVDSCFYVWLNGEYVGYSQVSHATSEFDITSPIREGNNVIAVLVLKWCDGSYLEDQDKFRMSGIFRDVYLLKRPERAVFDYKITTDVTKDQAVVKMEAVFTVPVETKVTLEDADGAATASGEISGDGTLLLTLDSPALWNTENPYLYTLIIETEYETIVDRIGFRTIEIKDGAVCFNGQKIKFRGVNRHDADPVAGPAVGMEQLMTDLIMMKRHNFNAIRSSHYPNAPYFYQLCDQYGFMVIDEADLEAHGPYLIYRKEDTEPNRCKRWNEWIADDPIWEGAILDRVQLMIQRDKNRPCIVMWSMGNESAYGCNFEKALRWTKEFDPDRLTQYESARYRNYDAAYDFKNLDLYSRMYPSIEEIQEYLDRDAGKPFLLVEYCHSMGNGPGDLEDYFWMIQKHDSLCGGFVWEWCDHAIGYGVSENGKTMYLYGGDHGEKLHDGNFCVDGLVYPDRKPHTGLLEYQNVYRPARVVAYHEESGELTLHNYMDFDDLQDYAEVCYEVTSDGAVVESGTVPGVSIAPHGEGTVTLKVKIPEAGRVFLKVVYRLKKEMPLIPKKHLLGFDEVALRNADGRNQSAVKLLERRVVSRDIGISESDDRAEIRGKDFHYVYSKKKGMFESICFAGREYLDRPMELNIWRAPTDNDMYVKEQWKRAGYDDAYVRAYTTEIRSVKDDVEIVTTASVSAASVQRIMDVKVTWTIDGDGGILAKMDVVKDEEFPSLPRFGIRLFLGQAFENVSYYGMGPHESYRDKHRSCSHGLYRAKAGEMHEDYIRPQENGSRWDCDYVELSDGRLCLAAVSKKAFSFNVSVYTQEALEKTKHNYELEKSGSTVFCLDFSMNGIGSNSCGPAVLDDYRFDEKTFCFTFKLVPLLAE